MIYVMVSLRFEQAHLVRLRAVRAPQRPDPNGQAAEKIVNQVPV